MCCSSRSTTIAPAPVPRCRAWCMAACAISKMASSSWCRNRLSSATGCLRNAPHYVAPLPTTVPVFDIFSGLANGIVRFLGLSRRPSRRGAIAIKAGLSIYDFLTRKRALMPRHQFRGRRDDAGRMAGAQSRRSRVPRPITTPGSAIPSGSASNCCRTACPSGPACAGAELCRAAASVEDGGLCFTDQYRRHGTSYRAGTRHQRHRRLDRPHQRQPVPAGSAAGAADGRHQGLAPDHRQCRATRRARRPHDLLRERGRAHLHPVSLSRQGAGRLDRYPRR